MSKFVFTLLAALGSFSVFNTPLYASLAEFSYRVSVPKTAHSCDQEARMMGDRFAKATGITAFRSQCQQVANRVADGTSYPIYTLVLSYQSETELFPYSAVFGDSLGTAFPSDSVGIYSKYSDCLSDLSSQSLRFTEETGLDSVSAFCQAGASGGYTLEVNGFGVPVNRLFAFAPTFFGNPSQDFQTQMVELVKTLGGHVASNPNNGIFYYAPNPVQIDHQALALFNNRYECLAQIQDARSIVQGLGDATILLECMSIDSPGSSSDKGEISLELVRENLGMLYTDLGLDSPKYSTFNECQADKSRVVQNAIAEGHQAYGAICRHSDDSSDTYVAEIFESS